MVYVYGVRVCVCVCMRMRMPAFFFALHSECIIIHFGSVFAVLLYILARQTCIFRQEIIVCEPHRRSRNSFCARDFKVKIACDSLTVSHSKLACCWFSTGGAVQSVSGQFFAHVIVRQRRQVGLDGDSLTKPPTVNRYCTVIQSMFPSPYFSCTFWSMVIEEADGNDSIPKTSSRSVV